MPTADHPAPLTACRPATADELPRNAARLLDKATAAGWRAAATYAHGTSIDAQGQPGRLIESVVLRLASGAGPSARRAVAVWHDGGFAYGYLFGADQPAGPLKVGHRALVAAVTTAPTVPEAGPRDVSPQQLPPSAPDNPSNTFERTAS